FPTKEAILLAVFDRLIQLIHQRIEAGEGGPKPCVAGGTAWERLQHFLTFALLTPPQVPEFHSLQYTFLSQIGHREDFRARLAERHGGRGRASKGGVLSWSLCVILLMTTAAFGYRAYRVAPAVVTATTEAPRVEAPAPTTTSTDAATTVASSGDVVLQQKGY